MAVMRHADTKLENSSLKENPCGHVTLTRVMYR